VLILHFSIHLASDSAFDYLVQDCATADIVVFRSTALQVSMQKRQLKWREINVIENIQLVYVSEVAVKHFNRAQSLIPTIK